MYEVVSVHVYIHTGSTHSWIHLFRKGKVVTTAKNVSRATTCVMNATAQERERSTHVSMECIMSSFWSSIPTFR